MTYEAVSFGKTSADTNETSARSWSASSGGRAYELRELIRQCREHEVPLALFPHLSPGLWAGAYEYAELYDQVLALCHEEAGPCVDLRATFAPCRDYTSFWVNRFDPHPNARAHRLTGERIVEALGPAWLEAGPRAADDGRAVYPATLSSGA